MVVGLALLTLGGGAAAIAFASGAASRHPSLRSLRAAAARARSHRLVLNGRPQQLPRTMVSSFAVLRRASSARARTATGPMGQFPGVPTPVASTWGLVVGDATQIPNSAGINLWLVPGDSGTCFIWRDSAAEGGTNGGDCVPNSMALDGKLSPIEGGGTAGGGTTVIGLAPNQNAAVTLTHADGSSQVATVSDNVYVAQSPAGFKAVTLRDASGKVASRGVPDGGGS